MYMCAHMIPSMHAGLYVLHSPYMSARGTANMKARKKKETNEVRDLTRNMKSSNKLVNKKKKKKKGKKNASKAKQSNRKKKKEQNVIFPTYFLSKNICCWKWKFLFFLS